MGCDIHFYVEVKQDDGSWKSVDKWETDEDGYTHVPWDDKFYGGRNYDLFAILANVRNGSGTAGVKTGDGFNVIAEPRGLPEEASPEVSKKAKDWEGDAHSHSWFTVAELKAFNWKQKTQHQGFVELEQFKIFIKEGRPRSWCRFVSGSSVIHVSIDEMMDFMKGSVTMQEGKFYYTTVRWTETYANSVGSFLTKTLPKMESLGDPEKVRTVFWFDN